MKRTMRYRSKTVENLKAIWVRNCNKCNEIKPGRTHHCASCGRCVFMMDHHCPWVNNCVGMENYRYFLLFIFYLMIGSAWYALTIVSIWHHHSYVSKKINLMNFIENTKSRPIIYVYVGYKSRRNPRRLQLLELVSSMFRYELSRILETYALL